MKPLRILLFVLIPGFAQAAAPSLSRLEPSGAAVGSSVEITAVGSFPKWPAQAWVEGKGVAFEPLKDKGKFRVTVAADAPPGPRWVRFHDQEGATEARPFVIGSLPEQAEVEPNDQISEAQKCPGPALVVNGKLGKSGDVDVYAVDLKQGQTLVAAIVSRQILGSPMDGVLQVASAQGFVQAQNDDDGGMDPLLAFTAPRDATYLVRVFAFPATADSSIRFAGGDAYLYRLTLTTGPFLDHVIPSATGTDLASVDPIGWNLPPKPATLAVRESTDPETALVAGPGLAPAIEIPRLNHASIREVEPSSRDQPQSIAAPISVTGRIETAAETDGFEIDVKKNVRLQIQVQARKLGGPLDPTLKILDPSGKVVLELDDSDRGGRDIDATFTPTQDGKHRLLLADLHGRGGPRFVYRLTVAVPQPDFSLKLAEQRLTIKPGTATNLKVDISRINGFDRPIEIRALGLPPGVSAAVITSAPKGDSAKSVTLKFEADPKAKGLPLSSSFRVEGHTANGDKLVHVARFAVADIDRPLLDPFLTALAPPPPPPPPSAPKPEAKPAPTAEEKPKPKPKEVKTSAKAPAEKHWAFEPLTRPRVPSAKAGQSVSNPIDAFLLANANAQGVAPGPLADRRTLIRRVTFDLLGLPPTPEEVNAFLSDQRVDAYERLVDRLLARPEYGERWARHWFDVARYAESNGYERDGAKPGAWRYRDYVINALNQDKPFDRFLIEQVAGDELEDATPETRTATSFLRLGTWDDEPADDLVDRYDQLDDVLGTVTAGFLGITLRCARCHDHKFDPFSQAEYYQTLAIFEPLQRPQVGRTEYEWPICSPSEWSAYQNNSALQMGLTSAFHPGAASALARPLPPPATAYVWREMGPKPAPTRVFKRGDPTRAGEVVPPGVPRALNLPISGEIRPTTASSGRRLWFARWMASPEHPLTARVIVNRIWQWHFGVGLVASSNDFGTMGEAPTHPELLDWLATELIRQGWRIKAIHRQILTSHAYQRVTGSSDAAAIYAAFPARRLEAEAIRDAILAVSGSLNRARTGPSVYPEIPRAVLEGQSRPGEGWGKSSEREASRRSVYVFAKRSLAIPELELLDTPDTTASCERRLRSTTGPQALTFLNGDFIQNQSRRFAARLEREAQPSMLEQQVNRAFELTVSRPPTPRELAASLEFLKKQATQIANEDPRQNAPLRSLEAFCLVMLNLNDFVSLK